MGTATKLNVPLTVASSGPPWRGLQTTRTASGSEPRHALWSTEAIGTHGKPNGRRPSRKAGLSCSPPERRSHGGHGDRPFREFRTVTCACDAAWWRRIPVPLPEPRERALPWADRGPCWCGWLRAGAGFHWGRSEMLPR